MSYTVKFKAKSYILLPTQDQDKEALNDTLKHDIRNGLAPWKILTLFLVSDLLFGGLGLFCGIHVSPQLGRDRLPNILVPAGHVQSLTVNNKTFSNSGPLSDAAWDAMFPSTLGFVQHPELSPNVSLVAVFHELHCLNMLRIGYYAAINRTLEEMQRIKDKNGRPDPIHLRHCFDYLRQGMMCAADTNLEPVDLKLGGSSGWGYMRTCRDFDEVKAWSERWGRTGRPSKQLLS